MATSPAPFRWTYLPYCLEPTGDGCYAVLNRSYKPLGMETDDWVDYASHPATRKFAKLTTAKIAAISATGEANAHGRIYLYNDGCVPTSSPAAWAAYAKRLAALAKIQTEPKPD